MQAVNVRQLKANPSTALAAAKNDVVVVMNRDSPQALLVDLEQLSAADLPSVRFALAAALFKSRVISAGLAARVAQIPLSEALTRFSSMGIPLVGGDGKDTDEILADIETGRAWLKATRK
jgi:antitoxin (DNA-binding transcriptional repressor) of toxin-antitoxin stability system